MADEPADILLEYMKRFAVQLNLADAKLERIENDLQDIKLRMANTEEGIVGINRRLDRTDERLRRIERRLELTEA